jgi:hypothetical protein
MMIKDEAVKMAEKGMVNTAICNKLRKLRPGDRVFYRGDTMDVGDYSTYHDPNGYATEEWLLETAQSFHGKAYYLLREFDPTHTENPVRWYLSEPIPHPRLYLTDKKTTLITTLWEDMQQEKDPYSALKLFYKIYYFESKTKGEYQKEGSQDYRITWDYWDKEKQQNLALEAWSDGNLLVYLSTLVCPEDFSNIRKNFALISAQNRSNNKGKNLSLNLYIIAIIIGLFLMIFG